MTETAVYRHTYDDPRISEAYRLYVDGKVPLRQLAAVSGVSTRTLTRYSGKDNWADEQAERLKAVANGHTVAAVVATLATDGVKDIEARLAEALSSSDQRERIAGVVTQQRLIADELMGDLRKLVADVKAAAETRKNGIPAGQFIVLVGLLEKLAAVQRKAHGIPDKMDLPALTGECARCTRLRNLSKEEREAEIAELEREASETAERRADRIVRYDVSLLTLDELRAIRDIQDRLADAKAGARKGPEESST